MSTDNAFKADNVALDAAGRRTLHYNELPPWRQDNPAILTGYRKEVDHWWGCVQSWRWWHNETVNIWSHLLGGLISLAALGTLASCACGIRGTLKAGHRPSACAITLATVPSGSRLAAEWEDTIFSAVFLLGCTTCFLCSAIFHSSLCLPQKVVRFMNRVDYFGILALGTVNFFPTFHYGFFCDRGLRDVYVALMTISGSTGVYLVCAPTYATAAYRRMRTYTFFALGFVVLIPFGHAIQTYGFEEASQSMSFKWIAIEAVAYIGGALLYAERCPEHLSPGTFDLLGSSHQIFHCCSLLAALSHYMAIREGFKYRYESPKGICTRAFPNR